MQKRSHYNYKLPELRLKMKKLKVKLKTKKHLSWRIGDIKKNFTTDMLKPKATYKSLLECVLSFKVRSTLLLDAWNLITCLTQLSLNRNVRFLGTRQLRKEPKL